MQAIAIALHLLAVVIWVGGMFFAYMIVQPLTALHLEAPQRLALSCKVFARFFRWVWAAVIVLPASGYFMAYMRYGAQANFPLYIHLMQGFGILMMLVFFHCFFAPYRRLRQALAADDLADAGRRTGQIRSLIGITLTIGLTVIVIAGAGRMLG